ncbi:hypothetical protein HYH02_009112 [Chlamydomonas schloesseri]|uniref:glycerophosphodiester phosphodiesterase n=1 Tax=Chlamydomonas schloesseri TaxID=2026947 RepID=A0A836B100_9CHLO|nr:hypothetical protein HYH02_009112 [Chlamydomonas schloesseri]|eukprot:KAG2444173.1 hypothetical protein HYH02_009112 [Chlamydomonas schloesseri]
MGENLASHDVDGHQLAVHPAYRENTIQSFQQAAKCGVGFVEFDVQVTRDNIPIIWHDDDVVFGAVDAPQRPMVKDLTLAELQALCGRNTAAATAAGSGAADLASSDSHHHHAVLRGGSEDGSTVSSPRGGSEDGSISTADDGAHGGRPRSKLLRLFRDRSTRQAGTQYEPWACTEDDSIPTLEAVFRAMPPEVGFDIEIKMTTGDDVVHTPAEEVDRMLSAILPVVDRLAGPQPPQDHFIDGPLLQPHPYRGPAAAAAASASTSSAPTEQQMPPQQQQPVGRRIMFSSFDPDVCVELRRRQSRYPVYYLSGCGLYAHADARRTSIPAALSFAAEKGMRGVVMPASVLLQHMDTVANAGASRLELMTYGLENNDLGALQAQADAGVVAAIVDEVAGVTAALGGGGALMGHGAAGEEAGAAQAGAQLQQQRQ